MQSALHSSESDSRERETLYAVLVSIAQLRPPNVPENKNTISAPPSFKAVALLDLREKERSQTEQSNVFGNIITHCYSLIFDVDGTSMKSEVSETIIICSLCVCICLLIT